VIVGIIIISTLVLFQNFNSCTARQFSVIDEIIEYERSYDPNICISIAEKIDKLNVECKAGFETPDCG
jgi:low affinity Fe/Cu permease